MIKLTGGQKAALVSLIVAAIANLVGAIYTIYIFSTL